MNNSDKKKSKVIQLRKNLNSNEFRNDHIGDSFDFPYTKFLVPEMNQTVIERNRLYEILDKVYTNKLISVSAPAGYGKTALVSCWINHNKNKCNCTWISINKEDNDIYRFWKAFALSIIDCIPSLETSVLPMFRYNQLYPIQTILIKLINVVSEASKEIIVVLDNFQFINNNYINETLKSFINTVAKNLHLIIISTKTPSTDFAVNIIRGEAISLSTQDLKFEENEVVELLQKSGVKCTAELPEKVMNITEGWIAAIRLLLLNISDVSDIEELDIKGLLHDSVQNKLYIMEYLMEEAINKQSDEIKDFIYKTSALDTLNTSLCNAVLDIDTSYVILEELKKNNLFLFALDKKSENYRYHNMFSEILGNHLKTSSIDVYNQICLKASRWYETNKSISEAIAYSIKSDNCMNTIRIIEEYGYDLVYKGEYEILNSAIENIPSEILCNYPNVCIKYALALAITSKLDKYEHSLKSKGIDLNCRLYEPYIGEVGAVRFFSSLRRGDSTEAVFYSKQALQHLDSKDILRGYICCGLVIHYLMQQKTAEAETCMNEAYSIALHNNDVPLLTMSSAFKMIESAACGKLNAAYKMSVTMLELLKTQEYLEMLNGEILYMSFGLTYLELYDIESAYKYINKSIEISKLKNDTSYLIKGYAILSIILAIQKKNKEAITILERTYDICEASEEKVDIYFAISDIIWVLTSLKKIDMAEKFLKLINPHINGDKDFTNDLAEAFLAAARKQYGTAIQYYEAVERLVDENTSFNTFVLVCKSVAYSYLGKKQIAIANLRKALEFTHENGFVRTYVCHGEEMKKLLSDYITMEQISLDCRTEIVKYAQYLLSFFDERNSKEGVEKNSYGCLSKRELEVVNLMSLGLSNKEIAEKLFVSTCTVKKHINNIYCKLEVKNRVQALEKLKSKG